MIPYDSLTNTNMDLIDKCVDRAAPLLPSLLRYDIELSLTKAHNYNPLDLESLLGSRNNDFAHDVAGIVRHVDHETGKLMNIFCPRSGHI